MAKNIRIDGIIGDWGLTAEDFLFRLEALELSDDDDLEVSINSVGGSVIEGFAIYNILKSLPNKVTTRIEGMAASIATLIALAGSKVHMSEVGIFMIHRASTFVEGDREELEKQQKILSNIDTTLINVYMAKTGLAKKEVETMVDAETWMTSAEAKKLGFVDKIINKVESRLVALASCKINNELNMSLLEKLKNSFKAEAAEGEGLTAEEIAALKAEEHEEEEEEEEEAEDEQDPEEEEEEDMDAKYVTKDELEVFSIVLTQALDSLKKTVTELNNNMDSFVENKVKETMRLRVSKGNTKTGNGPMGKQETFSLNPDRAKMKEYMNSIDEKTRNV